MSQEIRVLQCIECGLYQVDIVKKSNRWECKVCRQKQVVHREFFRGSGAACRTKVQQLNLEHGQRRQAQEDRKILEVQEESETSLTGIEAQLQTSPRPKTTSKWSAFVDEPILQAPKKTHIPKIVNPELDLEEPENTSSARKSRGSNKRKAPDQCIVNKKPFSKWQKFL
ncbi:MRN complex-interacting protein [Drosophila innubila]|uniref:MRN complex-interacting protein n=1 Tax=Drosophila innubila TaxID=198719 RepID=UPI00148BF6E2|nr:MRN complex-interacting protein [Drosophila innubila]